MGANKNTHDMDYGHNQPTGGTNKNTGKINPQGPTSGTENSNVDRKKDQQSTAGGGNSASQDDAA